MLLAIVAFRPWLAGHDPIARDIEHGLTELGAPLPPSADAPLGTDQLGRDVWARVTTAAGISLAITALSTLIALVIGVAIGVIAGYAGGRVDNLLMRLVDLVLGFPFLLFAIMLAAVLRQADIGSGAGRVVVTIGIVGWTTMARVIRGKALVIARSEYVTAARALGASPLRIVMTHVLPNVAGIITVVAALSFAQNLLAESVLSYLGLGPQPPTPTWGNMLFDARVYYRTAPWLAIAPGVALLVAVVAFNLVGEGLRDFFDPKDRR